MTQYMQPFSEMNFFVGENNAGKSIVLNCLHEHLPFGEATKAEKLVDNSAEIYRGDQSGQFSVAIGVTPGQILKNIKGNTSNLSTGRGTTFGALSSIVKKMATYDHVWVKSKNGNPALLHEYDIEVTKQWAHASEWRDIWSQLRNMTGGSLERDWIPTTISSIAAFATATLHLPKSMLIPAKRQLGPKDQTFDDLSGKGLIDHMAEIQNPDYHERHRKKTFEQINTFVRVVTGKPDATLEVPNTRKHLLVHMDNKVLPLASLGTGVHEVILIAAFCTIHQNVIMCIEEPEIHLHPVLQRKLIHYLQENTSNQYFVATHSAVFIDTPRASVFRVHNDGNQTFVRPALLKADHRQLVDELGYRASDIVQSNAVVWVEGPSDRIYVRHWLRYVAPELIEGVHYSILFYGGSLIRHLSADDEAIEDFINLRQLNRNFAVIIDSDKSCAQKKLKEATQRIQNEMSGDQGIIWVTKGREIENYVDPEILQSALKECHPTIYGKPNMVGQYDHAFYFARKDSKGPHAEIYKRGDKVGAALIVCKQKPDINRLDLRARLEQLATMIRNANGNEIS
ncbi:MAG: AAA family ATPase [Paracoccaceae bacterium]